MAAARTTGPVARGFARVIVALRWPIVAAWLAVGVAAVVLLPTLSGAGASPLDDVIPEDSPALRAAERATKLFGAPLASDVVVVQRDPEGLSTAALRAHGQRAREAIANPDPEGLLGAVPLANLRAPGVDWPERGTTAIDFLFIEAEENLVGRREVAERYRRSLGSDEGRSGITGAAPARLAQFGVIQDALPVVEIATVLAILLVAFLYFRSLLAPLVTLATAGLAYVVAVRLLAFAGEELGTQVPQEIEPLLVVLLLGLVTDYSFFFLAEARRLYLRGRERLPGARAATAQIAPTVLTAGVVVAACSAALLAGELDFFRVFGPGLALCAVVVTLVSVTLVPALIAILGPRLFGRAAREAVPVERGEAEPAIGSPPPGLTPAQRERNRRRFAGTLGAVRAARRAAREAGRSPVSFLLGRLMASRPVSLVVAVVCVAGLGWAAKDDLSLDLGVSYVRALPQSTEARTAGDDAAAGFGPGILAPTEIIIEQEGLGDRREALSRLAGAVGKRPGIAAVVDPSLQTGPLPDVLMTEDGRAARLVLFAEDDPTGADAIEAVGAVRDAFPEMLRDAGLPAGARVSFGGETALADETIDAVVGDIGRIALAVAVVTFVLLALFLRALVAPLALLLAGALGFLAALGLTSLTAQALWGQGELTYYVPLVGLVLLLALGSDYNVFIAGRIRGEARVRRLRDAIAVAAPEASRAITVAGVTLAATFALLLLVPLRPFRELALLLSIGVLVDALVVRPLLIPALISLLGRAAFWPGRVRRPQQEDAMVARIARLAGVDADEARQAASATLAVLGQRIGDAQARELALHLPEGLADAVRCPDGCEPFGYHEFIERVAQREGVDVPAAARDAAAVMAALRESVPGAELDYVRAALSEDYRPLLGDLPVGAGAAAP